MVWIYNTRNNKLQEKKTNHNKVWKRAYIRQTEATWQGFSWGCFGKRVNKLFSLTEKHQIPTFSLQTDRCTFSEVTMKTSETLSPTPNVANVSNYNKTVTKKKNHDLYWRLSGPVHDLKQQSSRGTDVFGPSQARTILKLNHHHDTQQLRWFRTKKPVRCLTLQPRLPLKERAKTGWFNHPVSGSSPPPRVALCGRDADK